MSTTDRNREGRRPRPQPHGRSPLRDQARLRVWRASAEGAIAKIVANGRETYDRDRILPRLIGWTAGEPDLDDEALGRAIRARLTRALRAERRRGRSGHWAYDLNRHAALLQALDAETAAAGGAARVDRRPCGSDESGPVKRENAARRSRTAF